jgi:hypothetical protein
VTKRRQHTNAPRNPVRDRHGLDRWQSQSEFWKRALGQLGIRDDRRTDTERRPLRDPRCRRVGEF